MEQGCNLVGRGVGGVTVGRVGTGVGWATESTGRGVGRLAMGGGLFIIALVLVLPDGGW
jgi:hypothetical protein